MAPRRALLVTLQIAILLVAGVPLVAVTQPFLPRFEGLAILLLSLALLVVALWRSASNLQGHVRAGAQVFLEALAAQSALDAAAASSGHAPANHVSPGLPGLGNAQAIRLEPLARHRPDAARAGPARADGRHGDRHRSRSPPTSSIPTADETLRAGDTLVVTGAAAAVEAARELLESGRLAGGRGLGYDGAR